MSNIRGHESMAIDELAEIAWPYLCEIQITRMVLAKRATGARTPCCRGTTLTILDPATTKTSAAARGDELAFLLPGTHPPRRHETVRV